MSNHTYEEIHNQPRSWELTIPLARRQWEEVRDYVPTGPDAHFLFVGCGTSLYIAQCAARCFQEITGRVSSAVPASEVFLSDGSTVPRGRPVVAFVISRSGTTSEALIASDHLAERFPSATVVGVTCNPSAELANRVGRALELPHASERSVVMTQSYTNMLLALQVVAAEIADDSPLLGELERLPAMLSGLMARTEEFGRSLGEELGQRQFVYLGLGPNYGLAQEAALKLQEMTQTVCHAYNPLEFRHGPISTVAPGTTAVLLEGDRERAYTPDLVADLQGFGASVAVASPHPPPGADLRLALPDDLSDVARCALYVPPVQLAAYYRAVALGLDPDRPRNLNQVVVLDE